MLLHIKSFTYRFYSLKAPWFGHECLASKRNLRKLERSYRFCSFSITFGSHSYQPITLFSTPKTPVFLFLPSTLSLFLRPVGKIFFPKNLFLFFLFRIFIDFSTTGFIPAEAITHHVTLLQLFLLPSSLNLIFHPSPSQTSSP